MSADLATLSIQLDSRPLADAKKQMQDLSKSGSELETILKKVVGAFGLYKVGQFIKDTALLSARYETLGVVVNVVGNNAGYTAKRMAAFQAGLQETGISAMESRNALAVMAQAHIDLAYASDLARIAQDAAVIGQMNSSEAFQRMIYGIQSGQVEILRTIGLNVNFEDSYKKLGAQLGKSAKDLTEVEKTMARTNAVMAKAPDIAGVYSASMGTAGKQLLSMKRYSEDLRIILGDVFKPALGTGIQAVNQGFSDMKKWVESNKQEMDLLGSALNTVTEQVLGLGRAVGSLVSDGGGAIDGFTLLRRTLQGIGGILAVITDDITAMRVGFFTLAAEGAQMWKLQLRGMMDFIGAIPDWLIPGNKQAQLSSLQSIYTGMEVARIYATKRADELSMQPLASEKWLDSVDQVQKATAWKDNIRAPGLSASGSSTEDSKKKSLYDWDAEAQAAARYAESVREAKAEWMNDESIKKMNEMKKVNSEIFGDMTSAIQNWSSSAQDALADFVTTGKADFKGLVQSMIADLARLAAQQGIKEMFGSMGGSSSSWVSALGSLFGGAFASGGEPPLGKVSLVGERGPELFVPKQAGTVMPAGSFGSNQTSITVNVSSNGNVDAKTQAKNATSMGRELEAAVIQIVQKHQRHGGELAGSTV